MTESVYVLTPISGIQVLKFTNMELLHFCHEFFLMNFKSCVMHFMKEKTVLRKNGN